MMVLSKINLLCSKACKLQVVALCAVLLPSLSACSQRFDLQGYDPQEYYAAHPIENKVETRHAILKMEFSDTSKKLSESDADALRNGLKIINPHAVESIAIYTGVEIKNKNKYVGNIKQILREYGYYLPVKIMNQDKIDTDKIVIDITYAAVVAPDCPDWKRSPVTTYSNMTPANYACAATVNLGLMVDNPRDLVRGQDSRRSNVERSAKALSDYRSGTETASPAATASPTAGQ